MIKKATAAIKLAPKSHKQNYIYAVGRRKTSIARVRLFEKGDGKITVNLKDYKNYFPYGVWQEIVQSPLRVTGRSAYDVTVKVLGGGVKGQAEAIRHGIARALVKLDESLRATLKPEGFLRRDPRAKERKKPGLKRARRAPQWQKR